MNLSMALNSGTAASIGETIYAALRDEILTCSLLPGAHIYEAELARRFDVSKSPVREALLRLQTEGFVDVLPRKGYRVRTVSISDARELYEMRELLELACVTRAIDQATESELQSLDRYRAADADSELGEWVNYNKSFHQHIAQICGNARMARASTDLIDQFDRLTYISVSTSGLTAPSQKFVDEHCNIIDAMQTRDKRLALRLSRSHIKSSSKRLFKSFDNPALVP